MSKTPIKNAALVLSGVVLTLAWLHWSGATANAKSEDRPATAPTVDSSSVVHIAENSPQFSFLKLAPAQSTALPVLEPVSARLTVDDNVTARVYPPVSGRVTRILVDADQEVKAGQPLLELDSADVANAVSDNRKARSDEHTKTLALKRAQELFAGGVIARKDLEGAEDDQAQAQAELSRTESILHNLHAEQQSDGHYRLLAPVAGVIMDRQVNPGTEVRVDAQQQLFTITQPSHLWALVDLPEDQAGHIHRGQSASLIADAFPDTLIPATVTSISTALDANNRRVIVRCQVDNSGLLLRPEMFGRVLFHSDKGQQAIRIPNSALLTEGLRHFVFVHAKAGTLEKRPVTLALQGHDESYVSTGLKGGEQLVTSGVLLLNAELNQGS